MTPNAKPEERARDLIDEQLRRAGWHVCDRDQIELVNHEGTAVREVIMESGHGRADYLLYLGTRDVRVIEAKPVGTSYGGEGITARKHEENCGLKVPPLGRT